MNREDAAWAGSLAEFFRLSESEFLGALSEHLNLLLFKGPDRSQLDAWRDSYHVLQGQLREFATKNGASGEEIGLIFEYVLPRERGRRPDAIILVGRQAFVLEFKRYRAPGLNPHRDQVKAYARDLGNYHSVGRTLDVVPVLVCSATGGPWFRIVDGVVIVSESSLATFLCSQVSGIPAGSPEIEAWLQADYEPLPSLIAAARKVFMHEPLPDIRRASSAGVRDAERTLLDVARQAKRSRSRHLALVTGVPGAGKTLVGLQFVYNAGVSDDELAKEAVFLSGNGPLVQVLQYALRSSVFVQDVHGFLIRYGGNSSRTPKEHIFVYDEAQRAWDAAQVRKKRGHGVSEPQDFVALGGRMDWCVLVGLIGEGQEIHVGEEAGLDQWNEAVRSSGLEWTVHCPPKLAHRFTSAAHIETHSTLDLTISLRSHVAEDVQRWVDALLAGEVGLAAQLAERVQSQAFDLYVTNSLEVAKEYVRARYAGEVDRRFGIVTSSKAKNLERFGVDNSFMATRQLKVGRWFVDPPDSLWSCCALEQCATEFSCQGLELDLPIVGWGDDLIWRAQRWQAAEARRRLAHNPRQLTLNTYRVLLTRGRDGLLVFVPPEESMVETLKVLQESGMRLLA